MDPIHWSAAAGYALNAATDVTGRPNYPRALDAWMRDALPLGAGSTSPDLGAGTGKFTPLLSAYEDDTPRYRSRARRAVFPTPGFAPP